MMGGKEVAHNSLAKIKVFKIQAQEVQAREDISEFRGEITITFQKNRHPRINRKGISIASPVDVKRRQTEQIVRYVELRYKHKLTPPWRDYGERHVEDIANFQLRRAS